MSLEEFNFDSLIMTSPEDKSGKPPMPIQQPNPSLVNIGPFSLQKLNIPDGFYTNPASWSKSSTGSGHTEHEDDSYRIEREIRMEYWNSLHDAHNSNNNNNNNLSRQISPSVTQIQVMEQDDPRLLGSSARLPYDNSFPPHGGFDLSYSASNRTTPTAASANAVSSLLSVFFNNHIDLFRSMRMKSYSINCRFNKNIAHKVLTRSYRQLLIHLAPIYLVLFYLTHTLILKTVKPRVRKTLCHDRRMPMSLMVSNLLVTLNLEQLHVRACLITPLVLLFLLPRGEILSRRQPRALCN